MACTFYLCRFYLVDGYTHNVFVSEEIVHIGVFMLFVIVISKYDPDPFDVSEIVIHSLDVIR